MKRRQFLKGMIAVPFGIMTARFIGGGNIASLQKTKTMHLKFGHDRKMDRDKIMKKFKIPFCRVTSG